MSEKILFVDDEPNEDGSGPRDPGQRLEPTDDRSEGLRVCAHAATRPVDDDLPPPDEGLGLVPVDSRDRVERGHVERL